MRSIVCIGIRALNCAIVLSFCIVNVPAIGQTAANFPQYRSSIKALGLTPLIPASTSFQPGYIYELRRNTEGNVFQKLVCLQAFAAPNVKSTISFPNEAIAREKGLDLSLKFLPPALANKIKAVLGVNVNQVSNVSISIPKATRFEVAQKVSLDPNTGAKVRRAMTADCAEILQNRSRNANGSFRTPLFMVISAVSPDTMKFAFDQKNGGKLSINADAAGTIAAGAGMKLESTTNQSFVLARTGTEPRQFIAADIIRLETADPNWEVSSTPRVDLILARLPADSSDFATVEPK